MNYNQDYYRLYYRCAMKTYIYLNSDQTCDVYITEGTHDHSIKQVKSSYCDLIFDLNKKSYYDTSLID